MAFALLTVFEPSTVKRIHKTAADFEGADARVLFCSNPLIEGGELYTMIPKDNAAIAGLREYVS